LAQGIPYINSLIDKFWFIVLSNRNSSPNFTDLLNLTESIVRADNPDNTRLLNKVDYIRCNTHLEVEMPAYNPTSPSYDDPNLVVFCRDIMEPVYQHTKPDDDEPNSITSFSCWGEVEPVCFSKIAPSVLKSQLL